MAHRLVESLGESYNDFKISNVGAQYSEDGRHAESNKNFIPMNIRMLAAKLILSDDDGTRLLVLTGTGGGAARWINRYSPAIRMAQPTSLKNIAYLQQEMINNGMTLPTKSLSIEDIIDYTKTYLDSESTKSPTDRWLAIKMMTHDRHFLKFKLLRRHFLKPFKSKLFIRFMKWYCSI